MVVDLAKLRDAAQATYVGLDSAEFKVYYAVVGIEKVYDLGSIDIPERKDGAKLSRNVKVVAVFEHLHQLCEKHSPLAICFEDGSSIKDIAPIAGRIAKANVVGVDNKTLCKVLGAKHLSQVIQSFKQHLKIEGKELPNGLCSALARAILMARTQKETAAEDVFDETTSLLAANAKVKEYSQEELDKVRREQAHLFGKEPKP